MTDHCDTEDLGGLGPLATILGTWLAHNAVCTIACGRVQVGFHGLHLNQGDLCDANHWCTSGPFRCGYIKSGDKHHQEPWKFPMHISNYLGIFRNILTSIFFHLLKDKTSSNTCIFSTQQYYTTHQAFRSLAQ